MKNRMKQLGILLVILLMVNIAQNGLSNPSMNSVMLLCPTAWEIRRRERRAG